MYSRICGCCSHRRCTTARRSELDGVSAVRRRGSGVASRRSGSVADDFQLSCIVGALEHAVDPLHDGVLDQVLECSGTSISERVDAQRTGCTKPDAASAEAARFRALRNFPRQLVSDGLRPWANDQTLAVCAACAPDLAHGL